MKRRYVLMIVAVLVVVTAVPVAFAARGHRGHGGGRGEMGFGIFGKLHALRAELNLSDAQVAQIKEIAGSLREENKQYREDLKENLGAVAQTLIANPDNVAGAQALLNQQLAAEQALKTNALRSASEALNVLTPEQREKLGQMLARRMAAE